jgi:hypothetical protein
MTKNTMYRTVPNTPKASTLKKSQAHSVSQWLFMNRFQVRFFSRSGSFNPVMLVQQSEVAATTLTFDWNADGRPDFGLRVEFSEDQALRKYDLTTFEHAEPRKANYHIIKPGAFRHGFVPNFAPPIRQDDLEFWKAATEMAILSIPIVGKVVLLAQAVTGRNIFGEKISTVARVIDGLLALLPVAGGIIAKSATRGAAALAETAAKPDKSNDEVLALLRSIEKEGAATGNLSRWRTKLDAGAKLSADESAQLVRLTQQVDVDARAFIAAAQSPRLKWKPNVGGPRKVEEAVELARSNGIVIPEDIKFAAVSGAWPKGRFAEYGQLGKQSDPEKFISWEEFYNRFEQIPVRLNPEIL